MNRLSLKEFLLVVARNGYGNPQTEITKADDGASIITCRTGDWQLVDTFYGGHPYSGQEIAYRQNQPVWAMQYRGWVTAGTDWAPIYDFLKTALLTAPADHPWRGPKTLRQKDLVYSNRWQGTIDNFDGQEAISQNGRQVYHGLYFGGLIDQN